MIGHAIAMFTTTLVTAITIALAVATPKQCAPGWYLEGVRPSGYTQCRPVPPSYCGEPVPPFNRPCPHDERSSPMVIYCTGGAHPIVVNARTVGCQR